MSITVTQPPIFLSDPNEVGIVAASTGLGQLKHGVEFGPKALMEGLLAHHLHDSLGLTLYGMTGQEDCGPLHSIQEYNKDTAERAKRVSEINQRISQWTYDHAMVGRMVLTLGGDHSIAIGSVSGIAKAIHNRYNGEKKLGLIWVDAHADINTPETSESGNIHGMPLAYLSGLAKATTSGSFDWITDEHRISLDKLVYIGIRDVDEVESELIAARNIKVFRPDDITRLGIKGVMDGVFEYLGPDTPIHLGFDIDGLDPSDAPGTGLPVRGGLTLSEGLYLSERLGRSGQLVSMDLVEFNPEIGSEDDRLRTLEAAKAVIISAMRALAF